MTQENREFSSLLVASTLAGIALCQTSFREIQECADWFCGFSIYTHELAHPEIQRLYKDEIRRQFPMMPERNVVELDVAVAAALVCELYGENIIAVRGAGRRDASPLATLCDLRPDADVLVVKT